jgi:uncharacterized protein (DUF169 family)
MRGLSKEKWVMTLEEIQSYGEELARLLLLRTSPLGVKLIEGQDEIPEGATRPKKDRGVHLALCQAFAMSRRQKTTVAMLKEDHWCWAPLIGFGLVEPPEVYLEGRTAFPRMVASLEAAKDLARTEPRLQCGKYAGIVSAPLERAGFEPDAVMIYCNSAQLRTFLLAVKYREGCRVESTFDPFDSCVHSLVPVILTGRYRITFPDPGEYQRALATEDEIIFSFPKGKLPGLISGLKQIEEIGHGYAAFTQEMRPDFPQPDFYKEFFRLWGL